MRAQVFVTAAIAHIEEIQGWWDFTFEQKSEVIKKTWARQEALFD